MLYCLEDNDRKTSVQVQGRCDQVFFHLLTDVFGGIHACETHRLRGLMVSLARCWSPSCERSFTGTHHKWCVLSTYPRSPSWVPRRQNQNLNLSWSYSEAWATISTSCSLSQTSKHSPCLDLDANPTSVTDHPPGHQTPQKEREPGQGWVASGIFHGTEGFKLHFHFR